MRAFACPRCGQMLFFDNAECLRCRARLGFDPERLDMVLVAEGGPAGGLEGRPGPTGGLEGRPGPTGGLEGRPGADSGGPGPARCANQTLAGCNWVLPNPARPGAGPRLCRSCRLTRTRPSDADLAGDSHVAERFGRAEAAKRRLVFQLLELRLLRPDGDAGSSLAFDFLVRKSEPIMIGHADGVVTIDLAESDDAYRERMRAELDEPYRTMLGHLRHEAGHYFWEVLVLARPEVLDGFRLLFGDERADYLKALERHYDGGPPSGWAEEHVSAYAAAHPWEDWAETWAHYLHIRDTLQTAAAQGVIVTGPRFVHATAGELQSSLMAAPDLGPQERFDDILADWFPLTYALNAINRSMGNDDLYPFVLSRKVIEKLHFVHQQVVHGNLGK